MAYCDIVKGQLVADITRAVRKADKKFERSGGSSRHWVDECFLPVMENEGLVVVREYTGVFPSGGSGFLDIINNAVADGVNQFEERVLRTLRGLQESPSDEALLIDCQRAHDVTIAERDGLVRQIEAFRDWIKITPELTEAEKAEAYKLLA